MEVQLQSPGGLRRELHVRIPAERVQKAVDERLRRLASRARIPGFRPGKAPMKIVQAQFGESARLDALTDLVNQTYPEALKQAGAAPAGQPQIDVTSAATEAELAYVARFEVYPEITLSGLEGLRIERPDVAVTEADVDRLILNLRTAKRRFEAVERAAERGDAVTVDFIGKLDGEPFEGGKAEGVRIEIGQGQFLPDLENGLVGQAAGSAFSVPVKFPEDYRNEQLKGRDATFDIRLHKVEAPVLPEIDAEFLRTHNVEPEAGEPGLREKCRQALEKERDKAIRARVKQQVLDQLLAANPVEIPQALIDQETPRLQQEAANRFAQQMGRPFKPEQIPQFFPAEMFKPQAERRVALGLLIGEVIKARAVQLDPARVEAEIEAIAADYETPEQVKQYYKNNPELLQGVRAMVLEEQVVESLIGTASVTATPMPLEQLLQRPAAA